MSYILTDQKAESRQEREGRQEAEGRQETEKTTQRLEEK